LHFSIVGFVARIRSRDQLEDALGRQHS